MKRITILKIIICILSITGCKKNKSEITSKSSKSETHQVDVNHSTTLTNSENQTTTNISADSETTQVFVDETNNFRTDSEFQAQTDATEESFSNNENNIKTTSTVIATANQSSETIISEVNEIKIENREEQKFCELKLEQSDGVSSYKVFINETVKGSFSSLNQAMLKYHELVASGQCLTPNKIPNCSIVENSEKRTYFDIKLDDKTISSIKKSEKDKAYALISDLQKYDICSKNLPNDSQCTINFKNNDPYVYSGDDDYQGYFHSTEEGLDHINSLANLNLCTYAKEDNICSTYEDKENGEFYIAINDFEIGNFLGDWNRHDNLKLLNNNFCTYKQCKIEEKNNFEIKIIDNRSSERSYISYLVFIGLEEQTEVSSKEKALQMIDSLKSSGNCY